MRGSAVIEVGAKGRNGNDGIAESSVMGLSRSSSMVPIQGIIFSPEHLLNNGVGLGTYCSMSKLRTMMKWASVLTSRAANHVGPFLPSDRYLNHLDSARRGSHLSYRAPVGAIWKIF